MEARDPRRTSQQPVEADCWTPAQAAEYAAARDFRLLQLLSTDRRALAAAQRLGVFRKAEQAWRSKGLGVNGHRATRKVAAANERAEDARRPSSAQRRSEKRRKSYQMLMAKVDSHLRQKAFRCWKQALEASRRKPPGKLRGTPVSTSPTPAQPARTIDEMVPALAQAQAQPTPDSDVEMVEGGQPPSSPPRDAAREEQAYLHAASDALAGRRLPPPIYGSRIVDGSASGSATAVAVDVDQATEDNLPMWPC